MNRTVYRAITILELLANKKSGLTLTEISCELDAPKPSIFGIINTLNAMHMLRKVDKKYYIGYKSKSIGDGYILEHDLYGIAQKFLEHISKKYEVSSSLSILEKDKLNYIYQYMPPESKIYTRADIPLKDISATGSGKVFLAFLKESEASSILKKMSYEKFTETTLTNEENLVKQLIQIKKDGYAFDNGEYISYIQCIAVPVFLKNKIIASISVSSLELMNNKDTVALVKALQDASKVISEELLSNNALPFQKIFE